MDIPSTFMLGGHKIRVLVVDDLGDEPDDKDTCGTYTSMDQTIRLWSGLGQTEREEVFLHECLEAIGFKYDLTLRHQDLQIIAVCLHQILTSGEGTIP